MSLTTLSLSNSPCITFSSAKASGHFCSICLFSKNWSCLMITFCSSTLKMPIYCPASYKMALFSLSRLKSLSPPESVLIYFFLELVKTRDWIFCIKISSSCLHDLLSCLCVLSMFDLTWLNFWTVHLETSINVLIFSRAEASNRAIVRYSLPLNWQ